jgi:hypothetical protein
MMITSKRTWPDQRLYILNSISDPADDRDKSVSENNNPPDRNVDCGSGRDAANIAGWKRFVAVPPL